PASNAVDPPNHNDGGTAIDHGTPTPPPTMPPAPPVDPLPPVNPQPADPLPGPADNHPVRDDHKAVAPTISAPADAKVPAGKPWRCAISTTGNPAPKLEADRLPTWLRLDGDVLRGTPAAADAGLVQVVLHASNGTAPDAEHRINIVVGTPPEITSKPVTEAAVGVRYEYAVELAGSPAPTLSAEKLPAWLAIDGTMLVGTPDAADAAKAPIVVKLIARNGFEPDATQELRIGFAGPTINSEPVIEAAGGKTYEYLIATTGSPAPTITASRLPDWMVLDGNRLWGVPRNLDKGRVRIKLTAANGIGKPATQEFTIQVKESDGIQDMPWSLATARSFIVVGLKWTVRQNNILGGNRIGSTEDTYEVIAVNGIGYTTHVKTPRSIQNDVVEWQEGDVMYPWCENVVVLCNPVVGEWTRSKSRIDVLGRKRDCIMLTCTDASLEGARVENYFYCEDYPIGSVQYSDTFSALGQPTGDEWVLETLKRP
ncbi:MAG: putative Ig domain-containing protein, partial [Planctomycetota bacterium]